MSELDAGTLLTGAQVCVVDAEGRVADLALGEAALEVQPETLFRGYCALKPVTAVATARVVAAGLLDLDAPLHAIVPGVSSLNQGDVSARHVLSHTAGLHVPTGVRHELLPMAERRRVLCDRAWIPHDWRIGEDQAFSELLGWYVLGLALEQITRTPLASLLREQVLEPFGLHDTWIGMTPSEFRDNAERIGVHYDFRDAPKTRPMLMERTERVATELNCAFGGYTTARDLAQFYARLVAQLRGAADPTLPAHDVLSEFCSPARPRSHDATLRRECTFGLGFMCTLEDFNFGPNWSRAAFGHSAWAGSSFGFGDPEVGVSVGVITNGLLPEELARRWRPRLLQEIYADLGSGTDVASIDAAPGAC